MTSFLFSICVFSTPLILLLLGGLFYKFPPKTINHYYGYRTTRSMKTPETWAFAQWHNARLIIRYSLTCLALTCLCTGFLLTRPVSLTERQMTLALVVIINLQVVFMLVYLLRTEKALKKYFDGDGNPL